MIKSILSIFMVLAIAAPAMAGDRKIPFFEDKELTPYWPAENKSLKPAKVGGFTAIKQNEKKLTQKEFNGQLSLINFFFVQCPKICPVMMRNVKHLQSTLGDQIDKIHVYSFSVQPEIDTPERLRNYAQTYKIDLNNWTLLTGSKKEIYRVGKDMFKADGAVGKQKSENGFIHTQNIYLVDHALNIRGIYDTGDPKDMSQLKADITILSKALPPPT